MIYVINLEDGGGQEFYLNTEGAFTPLASSNPIPAQTFRSFGLMMKRLAQLRSSYSSSCQLYGVEQSEFEERRQVVRLPKGDGS